MIVSMMEALQTALYARLTTAGLTVYDAIPDNPEYPYVAIGESEEDYVLTKDEDTNTVTHTLHIMSRYAGMKELTTINNTIIEALDDPLDMALFGLKEIDCIPLKARAYREYDDAGAIVRHGELDIQATIQQD